MVDRHGSSFRSTSSSCSATTCTAARAREDFVTKFETPYKALLDAGVKFYAALGNHDEQSNRFYKPWNMNGERYYTYNEGARPLLRARHRLHGSASSSSGSSSELRSSNDDWKIVYFHHPLYSSAGRHGSEIDLRLVLEPLFVKYGVNVVFSGHDHIYERIKPQKGIYYFVVGSAGQAAQGRPAAIGLTAAGFDRTSRSCWSRSTKTRCRSRRSRGPARRRFRHAAPQQEKPQARAGRRTQPGTRASSLSLLAPAEPDPHAAVHQARRADRRRAASRRSTPRPAGSARRRTPRSSCRARATP